MSGWLWARWNACHVKIDGRWRRAWYDPERPLQVVSAARARRLRQLLGAPFRTGHHVEVEVEHLGRRTVHLADLEPDADPVRPPSYYKIDDARAAKVAIDQARRARLTPPAVAGTNPRPRENR